jgi:hypothetical protein
VSEIAKLIHQTIDEINEQTPPEGRVGKTPQTIIVGPGSTLDSLGIINFLVTLEAKVAESTGRTVNLLNDDTLSDPQGPLRTVELIERFISERI